ncbi:hypothetical protein NC989_33085, partial [Pseudomonas aeruginosa]|nr:hypothetical protein [Pseudomonas aeruginosa]
MSTQNSAYSAFSSLLAEAAMPVSPAELHGHLLGRVCAGGKVLPDHAEQAG